jgi:hypothetical protein
MPAAAGLDRGKEESLQLLEVGGFYPPFSYKG